MSVVCRITTASGICEYTDLESAWAEIARAHVRAPKHFIGVVGARSRNSNDDRATVYDEAYTVLSQHPDGAVVIVSGACPVGADAFGAEYAKANAIPLIEFPPDWDRLGNRAGFVRNEYIAQLCDTLIALPAGTGGTENTIKHAERLGRKVTLV